MITTSALAKQAKQRKALLGLLEKGENLFSKLNSARLPEIVELKKKVSSENFHVVVLGTFKRGKSTFINALLGEEILPSYATPCTAVINEVKWGETPKAVVHFRNIDGMTSSPKNGMAVLPKKAKRHIKRFGKGPVAPLEIRFDELEEYVVIKDAGKDSFESINDSPYDHVEIFLPLPLLKNGVVIIDSPGLDECESRSKITEHYLGRADAILFILSCTTLASKTEMDFIDNMLIRNGFKDVLFICNRFDEIRNDKERQRIISYGREKLKTKTNFGRDGVFFFSAAHALNGRLRKDNQLIKESGIHELEKRLTLLVSQREKIKMAQPIRSFASELDRLTKVVKKKCSDAELGIQDWNRLRNQEIDHVRNILQMLRHDLLKIIQSTNEAIDYAFQHEMLPRIGQEISDYEQEQIDLLSRFANFVNNALGGDWHRQQMTRIAEQIGKKIGSIFLTEQRQVNTWLISEGRNRNFEVEARVLLALEQIIGAIHRLQAALGIEKPAAGSTSILGSVLNWFKTKSPSASQERQDVSQALRSIGVDENYLIEWSFQSFFLINTAGDDRCYLHFIDAPNMDLLLKEIRFPLDDRSKNTGDLKKAIWEFFLNRLKTRKDTLLAPHTRGWDDKANNFVNSLFFVVNKRLKEIDHQASGPNNKLSVHRKTLSNANTVIKLTHGIRASLRNLICDLPETP